MIHVLRWYGQEFELRRRAACNVEDALRFRSHGYALSFLTPFLLDPVNARVLRRVYAATHAHHEMSLVSDRELLGGLGWDLVSGALTINPRPRRHHEWLSIDVPEASSPLSSSPPRPAADRPPVAAAPAPATGPCSSSSDSATALTSAAENGVPFCEDCEP